MFGKLGNVVHKVILVREIVMYGHDMFMLLHGKTQENADLGNLKHAAIRSADRHSSAPGTCSYCYIIMKIQKLG